MIILQLIQQDRQPRTAPGNIEMPIWSANSPRYPHRFRQDVGRAFAEAWQWLQNEGLLMIDLDQPSGWFCLTRKGRGLSTQADIEAYKQGHLLPIGVLHARIEAKVRPMFLRGDYDSAVLQAFKEVEIAVRKAAALPADLIGVPLMRKAFNPSDGPLTDLDNEVAAEREAVMHMFGAAMGHCKNPQSHRDVALGRVEAAQLMGFASYLLAYVDRRQEAA